MLGEEMSRLRSTFVAAFCAVLVAHLGRIASAQTFGGAPPWGPEKPTAIRGETHPGERFERPIGNGLSLVLTQVGVEWEIEVTPSGGGDDYSRCVTPPFHGPNPKDIGAWDFQAGDGVTPDGVGQKRWIDFVLTPEDHRLECQNVDLALKGEDSAWGTHITGRCWLRPVIVKLATGVSNQQFIDSMKFEAECALHGAWELWRLPATYVIGDGFTGWVTVYYREKGKTALTRSGDRYVLPVSDSPTVHTSSDLRQDFRGARFTWTDGRPVSAEGGNRMIWGWQTGDAEMCSPYQSFFVGTSDQYAKAGASPAFNRTWNCSKFLRVEWRAF
jgi:hypothetical protein